MESNKSYLFLIKTDGGGWQVATNEGAVMLIDTESNLTMKGMPLIEAGDIFKQTHTHELIRIPKLDKIFND